MVRLTAVILALLIVLPLISTATQKESIAQDAALKAAGLFPEVEGTCVLNEKVTARLPQSSVKIINYDVMIGGKKAGEVSRIISLMEEGMAANVDVLVRYDDKGSVRGIVPLRQLKEGADSLDLSYLLLSLNGQDLRSQQAPLIAALNGISAGAALSDGMAPPAPEGGYPPAVRQLLLETGTKLPSLKMKDLAGNDIDASSYKDKKLLIAFISPDSVRSQDMAQAIEGATEKALKGNKVFLVYIIASPPQKALEYVNSRGLKGAAVADPAGILGRVFMVPYNPYLFMFDKGVLSAQMKWESKETLQEYLSKFLEAGRATK